MSRLQDVLFGESVWAGEIEEYRTRRKKAWVWGYVGGWVEVAWVEAENVLLETSWPGELVIYRWALRSGQTELNPCHKMSSSDKHDGTCKGGNHGLQIHGDRLAAGERREERGGRRRTGVLGWKMVSADTEKAQCWQDTKGREAR